MENLQEIFDTSVSHVVAQGKPSVSENGITCMYRGPEGLMCAAGPFVTDDAPEGKSFKSLEDQHLVRKFSSEEKRLVTDLQAAHDECARHLVKFVPRFLLKTKKLCRKYGLEWNHGET